MGIQAVVGTDGDRMERMHREGGSISIIGGDGHKGVDGLGVRGRQRNVPDRKRHRGGGGVPGRKGLQWSGMERGGGITL